MNEILSLVAMMVGAVLENKRELSTPKEIHKLSQTTTVTHSIADPVSTKLCRFMRRMPLLLRT